MVCYPCTVPHHIAVELLLKHYVIKWWAIRDGFYLTKCSMVLPEVTFCVQRLIKHWHILQEHRAQNTCRYVNIYYVGYIYSHRGLHRGGGYLFNYSHRWRIGHWRKHTTHLLIPMQVYVRFQRTIWRYFNEEFYSYLQLWCHFYVYILTWQQLKL